MVSFKKTEDTMASLITYVRHTAQCLDPQEMGNENELNASEIRRFNLHITYHRRTTRSCLLNAVFAYSS